MNRERALSDIRDNIARDGYHLYVVSSDAEPRFAYTIGLSPKIGKELILAGAVIYMYKEVGPIIRELAAKLLDDPATERSAVVVDPFGSFTFRLVDPSWGSTMMLGALDFYQKLEVAALQVVPDKDHWTVDVPDMTVAWSPETSPIWRGLNESWPYPVPKSSHAVTDLAALRGAQVTEACRWEDDYWELFAGEGPDIPKDQTRVVSLATLLASDPSLLPVLDIPVGGGIWRDSGGEWNIWKFASEPGESTD